MKALVLASGGVDSTTCLGLAVNKYGKENVIALTVAYGQKHTKEIKAARKTETGMKLMLTVPETKPVSIIPQNIPLEILYQDADVVLVN